jgi:hypothetical protein
VAAKRAKILDFLNGDNRLLNDLQKLTREISGAFATYLGGQDGAKLSRVMSHVFVATPSNGLQSQFVDHLLKERVDLSSGSVHVYFDALGPIVVALTLVPSGPVPPGPVQPQR